MNKGPHMASVKAIPMEIALKALSSTVQVPAGAASGGEKAVAKSESMLGTTEPAGGTRRSDLAQARLKCDVMVAVASVGAVRAGAQMAREVAVATVWRSRE